jgi:hypothetical protein
MSSQITLMRWLIQTWMHRWGLKSRFNTHICRVKAAADPLPCRQLDVIVKKLAEEVYRRRAARDLAKYRREPQRAPTVPAPGSQETVVQPSGEPWQSLKLSLTLSLSLSLSVSGVF